MIHFVAYCVVPPPIALPCEGQTDTDGDGVGDGCDNCIHVFNPGQKNDDGDATGNLCDPDLDNDGVGKCRYQYNIIRTIL